MTFDTANQSDIETLRQQLTLFQRAATHELNTPLAVIQGYLDLLEPFVRGDEAAGYVTVIRQELGRLMAVVTDLSLRNEIENGTLRVRPEALDVELVLHGASADLEAQHPDWLVLMEYDLPLPQVQTDPERLNFILKTLLRYAACYSPLPNQAIEMRVGPADGWMEFCVRDTAPTLPPEYREAIFAPLLAALPEALCRPKLGLGLGLYPAREIARRMGGDLRVEPADGGNRFILSLPLAGAAGS